jgi:transposase
VPPRVRTLLWQLHEEVRDLEARIEGVDQELEAIARENEIIRALREIPGVGLLTATALYAAVGDIQSFQSARHLASWLGLTPRERSSGTRRRLGRISKQGDVYLRMLLIHGARSALLVAQQRQRAGAAGQLSANMGAEEGRSHPREQGSGRTGEQAGAGDLGGVAAAEPLRRQLPADGSIAERQR